MPGYRVLHTDQSGVFYMFYLLKIGRKSQKRCVFLRILNILKKKFVLLTEVEGISLAKVKLVGIAFIIIREKSKQLLLSD